MSLSSLEIFQALKCPVDYPSNGVPFWPFKTTITMTTEKMRWGGPLRVALPALYRPKVLSKLITPVHLPEKVEGK